MDPDFGTFVILFFLIFGVIEFAGVIIPAMIRRSKAGRTYRPAYDIPYVLERPVSAEHVAQMRSWYFDQNDSHRYTGGIAPDPVVPVNTGYPGRDSPVSQGGSPLFRTDPGKDWNTINKANWKVQRANKAVREANLAILEANTAIQQAGAEDLEWIDEIAEIDPLRFT
jgi:hypothetical protein